MVSGKQPLSLIQARSNYKLVGQSFGSFVSALDTLACCTGKLHSLSVGRPEGEDSFNCSMLSFLSSTSANGTPLQETESFFKYKSSKPSCALMMMTQDILIPLLVIHCTIHRSC